MQFNEINRYSFWYYVKFMDLGDILTILSIFLIQIGIVFGFYKQINSGIIKEILVREKYSKYIIDNIKEMLLKSLLLFPLNSAIIYFFGALTFGKDISHLDGYVYNTFPNIAAVNPILYIIIDSILVFLFTIFIVNISLFIMRKVKRFYTTIVLTFIIVNIYNYLVRDILGNILVRITGKEIFGHLNIYGIYHLEDFSYLSLILIFALINIILSSILVYSGYRFKEKLVLDNE